MTAPAADPIPSSASSDTRSDLDANSKDLSATLIDDEASMDIAFLSMQQLLQVEDDPAAPKEATAASGLEPSIVSGTTDLFEGDLGDDGESS